MGTLAWSRAAGVSGGAGLPRSCASGVPLGARTPGRARPPLVCCLVMDYWVNRAQAVYGVLICSVP